MAAKPLVSIITPCYNGETFLDRYFTSILNQTYPNIELIFVNDGSTDKTKEIALSYKEKIENKGYSFHYIYQENAGPAVAINTGLKVFTGDYLTWPDSDDWMTNDCVEKKVNYLEQHYELGLVTCLCAFVDEKNLQKVIYAETFPNIRSRNVFEDILMLKLHVACGSYMLRSSMFLDVNPQRKIYETRRGQNWQMLLPISCKYDCGFLPEILYYIVVRNNSLSHHDNDYDSKIKNTFLYEDILINVVKSISDLNDNQKANYLSMVKNKYCKVRFELACLHKNRDDIEKYYETLHEDNLVDKKIRIKHVRAKSKFIDFVFKIAYLPIRISKKIIGLIKK